MFTILLKKNPYDFVFKFQHEDKSILENLVEESKKSNDTKYPNLVSSAKEIQFLKIIPSLKTLPPKLKIIRSCDFKILVDDAEFQNQFNKLKESAIKFGWFKTNKQIYKKVSSYTLAETKFKSFFKQLI